MDRESVIAALKALVGQHLVGTRTFCATRHFYFGHLTDIWDPSSCDTIGLECPWRLEQEGRILTGSGDYAVEVPEASGAPEPEGLLKYLQDRRLREFMGKVIDDSIVASRTIAVQAVDLDPIGGFRIFLDTDKTLSAFPSSGGETEWIFLRRSGPTIMMVGGDIVMVSPSAKRTE
jgi:hypothetical protein